MNAFVIKYLGGYYSAQQGRVRHLNDAQLFGLEEMAEETAKECGCMPSDIVRVNIEVSSAIKNMKG